MSNWKVTVGKLRDAWLAYPEQRRAIAAVPAGKPIFLTGTHRSGTTWLAKMLAASGIWYVHEPFSPRKGRWQRSFLYRNSEQCDPEIDRFFSEVLSGGFRRALNLEHSDHPLMPLRFVPTPCRRKMIKDPLACLLTSYLTRRFDLQTLILFRHPAGFAASVHRLGWPRGAFLREFLADDLLMCEHLQPHRATLEEFQGVDDLESAAALHGALTSVLWSWSEQGMGQAVFFEDLCSDPLPALESLFRHLGLPYNAQVREAHRSACFGPRVDVGEYHPHAVARDSHAMARSWVRQLDRSQIDAVRRVWDRFDLPLYRNDADWKAASA